MRRLKRLNNNRNLPFPVHSFLMDISFQINDKNANGERLNFVLKILRFGLPVNIENK